MTPIPYSSVGVAPSPATSGTALDVAAGTGDRFADFAVPFTLLVWAAGARPLAANSELLTVTARTGDALTVTRGTPARVIVVGDQVAAAAIAAHLYDAHIPALGSVTDGFVADDAAIAYAKLALAGSVVNADLVSMAGSKLTGAYTAAGLTMATARLLGRTTAGTGPAEEISVAGNLSLAGGVLTGTAPAGAAFTRVDDTNVTATLGGGHAAAVLSAMSLTLGWTGQLALTRGGTAASLTADHGALAYSTATALALTAAGSSGQILKSAGAGAPTWNTATALTKTDDTNVTLTLGGAHATALVNAASVTLGWTGTLAPVRGGVGFDASGVAKGGLITGTGAGTFGITTVGANGTVATADSSAAGGIAWSAAGSGTVTGSGTTGKIPKWSSASALADSIITESGGVITVGGDLAVGVTRKWFSSEASSTWWWTTTTAGAGSGIAADANTIYLRANSTSPLFCTTTSVGTTVPITVSSTGTNTVTASPNAFMGWSVVNGSNGAAAYGGYNALNDGGVAVLLYIFSSGWGTTGDIIANGALVRGDGAGGLTLSASSTAPVRIFTNTTEKMRVHSSGGVSIGNTTDPGAGSLSLAAAKKFYLDGGSDTYIHESSANTIEFITGGALPLSLVNGMVQLGTIDSHLLPNGDNAYQIGSNVPARWIEVWAVNGTIQTSDRRRKRDVCASPLGLDFIRSLHPISYRWNEGSTEAQARRHLGFVAQEVAQALNGEQADGLVRYDEAGEATSLNYTELIAPLVRAVQELDRKVNQ